MPGRGGAWFGRETPFVLEHVDDPLFERRLRLPEAARRRWIVLTYRGNAVARPLRPILRMSDREEGYEDFVLPGASEGLGHWLGYLPAGLGEIRLAVDARSGFVLERVGLRSRESLLAECLLKRPARFLPAVFEALKGNERRFRDTLRGSCGVAPLSRYACWKTSRTRSDGAAASVQDKAVRLIVPARRAQASLVAETVGSLHAQTHRNWSAVIAWSDAAGEGGLQDHDFGPDARIAQVPWPDAAHLRDLSGHAGALVVLSPGDRLTPDALAVLLRAAAEPAADMVYGDDEIDGGTVQPRLKPDWSPDLALVLGYQGPATLYTEALVARLGDRPLGSGEDWRLRFEVAAAAEADPKHVAHVPRVLARLKPPVSPAIDRAAAITRHLAATESPARVVRDAHGLDLLWPLPNPAPLATVVIPSRNRRDLIRLSSHGVLNETAYPSIELVIVDNGSTDPEVHRYYDTLRHDPRVRIERWPGAFNFSAMVNAGVAVARGEIVVLMNNDVAILQPDWLDAMIRQASRPEVGAVGAKLLYSDRTLQHVGVVVGLGGRAGHILRRRPADSPGHLGRLRVAHEVSAVTAACLAVSKWKFEAVGGFDAAAFPVDFNDVDFCLRLNDAGYKTVWTPKATLAHLESMSRGRTRGPARVRFEDEADRFVRRWRDTVRHDPFYHPALSLTTFGEDLE